MYSYLEAMYSPEGNLHSQDYIHVAFWFFTMCLSATLWNKRRKWKRTVELVDAFPGPKKYGILGTVPKMYDMALDPPRKLLNWFRSNAAKHGSVFRIWLFHNPIMVVADTEVAIKLYTQDQLQGKASCVTKVAKAVNGEGLLALPADVHSVRRKQWMPSFTRKQVEMSIKFFREQAIRLCDELEEFGDNGKEFDMLGWSVGCTFRAICYSAFGEEYMAKLPEAVGKDHMQDLHTLSLNMTSRVFRPWISNDFLYFYGTKEGRETMRCAKRGNRLTKNAIHERKKLFRERQYQSPKSNADFECFLDHMLVLMNDGHLTENEVIQELNAFIAAGYDTSGITICYVLYFLSLYPEHQDTILEELCGVIPSENWNSIKDYSITASDTKKMKYLELCIKETLRMYPILPVSPRSTTQDVELPDGRTIPGGTDVFVMLYLILRDPKYFPEPDKFLPERHLKPSPAFMPFTLGSRNCIGQVYAMFEIKVILAYLLMSYKWETTEKEGFQGICQGLLVPENGMYFKIKRRTF